MFDDKHTACMVWFKCDTRTAEGRRFRNRLVELAYGGARGVRSSAGFVLVQRSPQYVHDQLWPLLPEGGHMMIVPLTEYCVQARKYFCKYGASHGFE